MYMGAKGQGSQGSEYSYTQGNTSGFLFKIDLQCIDNGRIFDIFIF